MKSLNSLSVLILLGALTLSSCFTPPVVGLAHNERWTLESSDYPKDARLVEIARGGSHDGEPAAAPTLRGLFIPSDEGAPVVVHFAESSASLTRSRFARVQYHALAELGFASLAVDYRGVGLSDGEPSPRKLGEDALAIWEAGLDLVDGDVERLIVRGASLGTVATASLLAQGIEPAACIAFSPVRPSTVARLYGYARFWNAAVWLVAPLVRSFSSADPLEWFTKPGIPRLVVIRADDELLGRRDFERMKRGVEASGGVVEVPELHIPAARSKEPITKAIGKHIALADLSYFVNDVEVEFLRGLFPGVPDLDARLERVQQGGSSGAVERVWSDDAMGARLRIVLRRHRLIPPNLVLAAAQSLRDEEMDLLDRWVMKRSGEGPHESFRSRSFDQSMDLLDLEDPSGRLSIELVVEARSVLGSDLHRLSGAPRWSKDRIDALAVSILGFQVAGYPPLQDGEKLGENEAWRFGVDEEYARYAEPGQTEIHPLRGLREAFRIDAEGRSQAEAAHRLHSRFLRAAGWKLFPLV